MKTVFAVVLIAGSIGGIAYFYNYKFGKKTA